MFVEFNVNGDRMKLTPGENGEIVVWMRKKVFIFFTAWDVTAIAEGRGAESMFLGFFNEAKQKAKPILLSTKRRRKNGIK